jgi:hypothetical protein
VDRAKEARCQYGLMFVCVAVFAVFAGFLTSRFNGRNKKGCSKGVDDFQHSGVHDMVRLAKDLEDLEQLCDSYMLFAKRVYTWSTKKRH